MQVNVFASQGQDVADFVQLQCGTTSQIIETYMLGNYKRPAKFGDALNVLTPGFNMNTTFYGAVINGWLNMRQNIKTAHIYHLLSHVFV